MDPSICECLQRLSEQCWMLVLNIVIYLQHPSSDAFWVLSRILCCYSSGRRARRRRTKAKSDLGFSACERVVYTVQKRKPDAARHLPTKPGARLTASNSLNIRVRHETLQIVVGKSFNIKLHDYLSRHEHNTAFTNRHDLNLSILSS